MNDFAPFASANKKISTIGNTIFNNAAKHPRVTALDKKRKSMVFKSTVMKHQRLHICAVCAFEYEGLGTEQPDFHELEDNWHCPECGVNIEMFHHYTCDDFVSEMTGASPSHHLFSTQNLRHQAYRYIVA